MIKQRPKELTKNSLSLEEKTNLCTEAAIGRKAVDLVVLDLREYSSVTDFFLICSGISTRQVQSIADAMDDELGKRGINPIGREGYSEARWILMDYNDLVIHVFHHETRKIYDLEKLWGVAPVIFSHDGE